MPIKFLDLAGLNIFYNKIKTLLDKKVDKVTGMGLSQTSFTSAEKTKLEGIASGANKYTHPSYTAKTSGLYKTTVDASGHVSAATAVTKTDITSLGIPAQDTTYSEATTSTAGLMSSADKTKLTNIEADANKYVHPTSSGNKHLPSGGSEGQFLKWSADGTGTWANDNNTTYNVASTTSNGLLSKEDKVKLDNIASGATANSASTTTPKANGTASTGSESGYSRGDHVHPLQTSVSGNAGTATKLATARSITLGTGVTSTATNFDGSANITIPVTGVKESYIDWGGKNFAGSYGCMDAAMIPDLGANRFAFGKPAGVTVQYSRNGGTSWTDYGATDAQKSSIFAQGGSLLIGKADSDNKATADYQLQITIDTSTFQCYSELNKFAIYLSTNGSTGSWCSIDIALQKTPTTWVNRANKVSVSGWSGWNIINVAKFTTYGNDVNNQYGKIRFTFGCTGGSTTNSGLTINRIMAFGGVGWQTPSTLAKTGNIYSYDQNQNVTFPAQISSGQVVSSGGFVTSTPNGLRIKAGNYGTIFRNDGSNFYLMTTASGSPDGTWNDLRPFTVNLSTGAVTMSNGLTATLTGNASTATTLQTARKLTIGSSEKSFNGSADISWTLDDIGAAASSHTHNAMTAATASAAGTAGFVPAPAAGAQAKFLRGDGTWQTPTNTTYNVASSTANGLMSKEDKVKLDGIDEGAQANVVETIKAAAGTDINSVGTPSVTVSTSGTETTLTFHNLKGATGAKGDKGDKGDKPVKGTDYFTDADKAEIVAAVLAAIPDGTNIQY